MSNGVRQGGILSPFLFNVYIDELSQVLRSLSRGCYINTTCANHILYADDSVLLAPSPTALQYLIDTTCRYFKENKLVLSDGKTRCMAIKAEGDKELHIPVFNVEKDIVTVIGPSHQTKTPLRPWSSQEYCRTQRELQGLLANLNILTCCYVNTTHVLRSW